MSEWARKRILSRLQQEKGTLTRPGALLRMGLVYPNHYYFGMSNLGFQTMYRIFNGFEGVSCERFFLPEEDLLPKMNPGSLLSYEQSNPGGHMDALAFSISYQNDLLHLLPLLNCFGMAARWEDRSERDPILLAGGPAVTINPEPVAGVLDAMVIGEGEEVAGEIVAVLRQGGSKSERLKALSQIAGVYVPREHPNEYGARPLKTKPLGGFGLISGEARPVNPNAPWLRRLVVPNPKTGLAQTCIQTSDTEFGDMFLLEVQRGCQWGCRFCAAGFMYRYPRYDALQEMKSRIDFGLQYRGKLGLIAGDLLGHEHIHEILAYIDEKGGRFSPSSVRLNAFTPQIISYLKKSGNRSIAIAPEAGSERLRRKLNKTFTQEEIVQAALQLAEGGIENIKLYIMIGLPTEEEQDIEELCELTLATRQALLQFAKRSGRMPTLTLSLSPFVPKPSTPLQYEAFAGIKYLKGVFGQIRQRVLSQGHIRLAGESALDAQVETLLSRGDRRVLEFLEAALVPVGNLKVLGPPGHLKAALRGLSFDPQEFIQSPWDPERPAPWDLIDHGMKPSYFKREEDKFERGRITPYCRPQVCRSCGVC